MADDRIKERLEIMRGFLAKPEILSSNGRGPQTVVVTLRDDPIAYLHSRVRLAGGHALVATEGPGGVPAIFECDEVPLDEHPSVPADRDDRVGDWPIISAAKGSAVQVRDLTDGPEYALRLGRWS